MENKVYFSCSYSLLDINVNHHDLSTIIFFPKVGVHVFPKFQSIIVQIIQVYREIYRIIIIFFLYIW